MEGDSNKFGGANGEKVLSAAILASRVSSIGRRMALCIVRNSWRRRGMQPIMSFDRTIYTPKLV
jgi:hypothetical protein